MDTDNIYMYIQVARMPRLIQQELKWKFKSVEWCGVE